MTTSPSNPSPLPPAAPAGPGAKDGRARAVARARLLARMRASPALWTLAAIAAVLLFNAFFTPGFMHLQVNNGRLVGNLVDIAARGSPLVILAMGMTLVIATGGVDLSVGAVMAIAGAAAAASLPLGVAPALAIGLACGLLAGLWNGVLVAIVGVQPIVATLVLMVAGRGVAQLITHGNVVSFSADTFPAFVWLSNGFLAGLPAQISVAAIAVALAFVLTRGTAMGLFLSAVGGNPVASRYAGVNAKLVRIVAYTACGVAAALAGLLAASDIKAADPINAGLNAELDAILAVCIGGNSLLGGRFSLAGSVAGALLIQTLRTAILSRGVPREVTLVVEAALVLLVCLLQSESFRRLITRRPA